METTCTKQKILNEALKLFSVSGFGGTSIKQIATAVGIKDSSLYKHFKSKQEIFDILLDEMNRKFQQTVTENHIPSGTAKENAKIYAANDLARLKSVSETIFRFFISDPYASSFRKMLIIEQYNNNRAAEIFRNFFIDEPLKFQTELFYELGEINALQVADPEIAARHFYSPLFLLLMEYDNAPDKIEEAVNKLMLHIEQFGKIYEVKI